MKTKIKIKELLYNTAQGQYPLYQYTHNISEFLLGDIYISKDFSYLFKVFKISDQTLLVVDSTFNYICTVRKCSYGCWCSKAYYENISHYNLLTLRAKIEECAGELWQDQYRHISKDTEINVL